MHPTDKNAFTTQTRASPLYCSVRAGKKGGSHSFCLDFFCFFFVSSVTSRSIAGTKKKIVSPKIENQIKNKLAYFVQPFQERAFNNR